jgi:hypothetical protein
MSAEGTSDIDESILTLEADRRRNHTYLRKSKTYCRNVTSDHEGVCHEI